MTGIPEFLPFENANGWDSIHIRFFPFLLQKNTLVLVGC